MQPVPLPGHPVFQPAEGGKQGGDQGGQRGEGEEPQYQKAADKGTAGAPDQHEGLKAGYPLHRQGVLRRRGLDFLCGAEKPAGQTVPGFRCAQFRIFQVHAFYRVPGYI